MSCIVYWLHDDTCVCPWRHGYIGVSERWKRRLWRHQREKKLPEFNWQILFRGTRDECLQLEEKMRPTFRLGWNIWIGGRAGATSPKSESQRAKMKAAALLRWADEEARKAHSINGKRAFEKIDRTGASNGHFGKRLSPESKQRISEGRMGKGLGNQNWRKRKPYSAEALRKMSEASKLRWQNQRKEK